MKDKKITSIKRCRKRSYRPISWLPNPPYNDREAALFMQEIKEKSEKSGGILGLKKIKETFALIEEAKNYIEQKESIKYIKRQRW